MRDDIPGWVLTESHHVSVLVQATYDGEHLADVDVDAATLDWTADTPVPGRLDLTCPSMWQPATPTDPLAVFGQRLTVLYTVGVGGQEWSVPLGQFRVQGWDHATPAVTVEALSLEQLILDYRFDSPYQRPSGATFASTLRGLCAGLLPVDTTAMTDRALPGSLTTDWEEDRMAAVRSLAAAWPADLRVDPDGVLVATPERVVQSSPHVSWVHGQANAYVSLGGGALRDEVYNAVVARGEKADGSPVQATAVDNNPASPTYFYGPYGRRQRFYESPLITTQAQELDPLQTVEFRYACIRDVGAAEIAHVHIRQHGDFFHDFIGQK